MGDHIDLSDPEMVEQRRGVLGHGVEADRHIVGLGGLAEVDLIRRNHPIPCPGESLYRRLPVRGREVAPVQKQDGAAVRGCGRGHIHVGEAHGMPLDREQEEGTG